MHPNAEMPAIALQRIVSHSKFSNSCPRSARSFTHRFEKRRAEEQRKTRNRGCGTTDAPSNRFGRAAETGGKSVDKPRCNSMRFVPRCEIGAANSASAYC